MKVIFTLLLASTLSFSSVFSNAFALTVSVSSKTNVAVNGQSTGSVTLSGSGGTAPYQYSKDGVNFQPSAIFSSLAAGNYTFTIKDATQAIATVNATVTQPAALALSISSQTNVSVIGQSNGSVTLSAGGGTTPYQYSKDGINYQSSPTFNSLAAGSYTFTVRDSYLNTATISVVITQSNTLTLYLSSQTNVLIIGQSTGSVTLTGAGGTQPYQFSKDGISYQSSATFNSLAAGNYTFTVRDAAFNTSSITTIITEPAVLTLNVASKTNVSVFGQNSGVINLSASGGTPPYQYSKDGNNFQPSATFPSLAAGSYTFTVKDAASGIATTSVTITQPEALILSLASQTDVDIYGRDNGIVTLSASGGIGPYQYSMDGSSFQTSATFNSLPAGAYSFTVRDAASATAVLTIILNEPQFDVGNIKAMNNFTPNGDGVNDKWEIENISDVPEHTLTIFDRAGRVLLKVKNYQNDWDGSVDGTPLAEGTYYYAFTFDTPGLGVKKGFITLIK